MAISFMTIINGLFYEALFLIVLALITHKVPVINKFGVQCVYISSVILLIRFLFPVEFKITQNIRCSYVLPQIQNFLYSEQFNVNRNKFSFMSILIVIWVVGILLKVGWKINQLYKFHSAVNCYLPITNATLENIRKEIQIELGEKEKKIRFYLIPELKTPCLIGLFHPAIILTNIEIQEQYLYYILKHELLHYYHKDIYLKYLIELFGIIYWWNPLYVLLKNKIYGIMEMYTDYIIISNMNKHEVYNYLKCLLHIMTYNKKIEMGIAMIDSPVVILEKRFSLAIEQTKNRSDIKKWLIIFPTTVLLISYLFIIEPYYVPLEINQSSYEFEVDDSYLIYDNNKYSVYLKGKYMGKITQIQGEFKDLPIYTTKEVMKIEEK